MTTTKLIGISPEAIPITVESLVAEWMHDGGTPKSLKLVREAYTRYGYMIGHGIPNRTNVW
jgi:hypothetical protein